MSGKNVIHKADSGESLVIRGDIAHRAQWLVRIRRYSRAIKTGRAMNHYEATLPNIVARIGAWVRGLLRRYRKPLLVIGAASATVAISMGATQAPAMHYSPVTLAAR